LRALDETQAAGCFFTITTHCATSAARCWHQPKALVIANRFEVNTSLRRKSADFNP
jgi:hypothetical protein